MDKMDTDIEDWIKSGTNGQTTKTRVITHTKLINKYQSNSIPQSPTTHLMKNLNNEKRV